MPNIFGDPAANEIAPALPTTAAPQQAVNAFGDPVATSAPSPAPQPNIPQPVTLPSASGGVMLSPGDYERYLRELQASPVDVNAPLRQAELVGRRETLGGRFAEAGAGLAGVAAQTGLGLLGTVAPETAANLGQATQQAYQTGGSRAAQTGEILGNVATSLGAALVPGGAGLLALSQAGNFRQQVVEKRLAGEQISTKAELAGAVGYGLAEYLGERFSIGNLRKIGQSALKGAAKDFIYQYAKQAGIEASEEFVTQLAQDGINYLMGGSFKQEVQQEGFLPRATNAAVQGGIAGVIGGVAASQIGLHGHGGQTETQRPAVPQLPDTVRRMQVKQREGENKGQSITFANDLEKARYIATTPGYRGPVVEDAKSYVQAVEAQQAQQQQPAPAAPGVSVPATTKTVDSPVPTQAVRDVASAYAQSANIDYNPDTNYEKVDETRAKKIADWYDKAQNAPNDPQVKASYDALKSETKAQYDQIVKAGYTIEPWLKDGPAYKSSKDMIEDVSKNKHLFYDPTSKTGFGTGQAEAAANNPMLEDSGIKVNGQSVPYNDLFRAVHDFFGHAKEGVGFGPRGEENAWRQHSQMYSELARPAMTSETRGQNSWVNFGPFGEQNRANPKNTTFAEQKAVLAPDWVVNEGAPTKKTVAPAKQQLTQEQLAEAQHREQQIAAAAEKQFAADEAALAAEKQAVAQEKANTPIPRDKSGELAYNVEQNQPQRAASPAIERLDNILAELRKMTGTTTQAAEKSTAQTSKPLSLDQAVSEFAKFVNSPDNTYKITSLDVDTALKSARNSGGSFRQVSPQTNDQAKVSKVFADVLGGKVIWYEGTGNGFVNARHPGIIFLNANLQGPKLYNSLAHELMHTLATMRPGLFQQMLDALPPEVRQKAIDEYKKNWESHGFEKAPARLMEEGVTVPFGKISEGQNIMRILQREAPTVWERIRRWFHTIAAKAGFQKSKAWVEAMNIWESLLETPLNPVTKAQTTSGVTYAIEGEKRKNAKIAAEADLTPNEREIWNKLSEEEKTWVTAPGMKRVAASYNQVRKSMPSEQWQAAIRAGKPLSKWYQKATAAIRAIFGKDAPLFTALLAADSPRQKVDKNLNESLNVWRAWDKAGRPTDPQKILDAVKNEVNLVTRLPNIVRALSGTDLSGPKVNSFHQNLLGNMQFVTNDTWMAQFAGLDHSFFGDDAQYLGFSALLRDEAKIAGVDPAEAQAAVWSFFSVLANSVNSTTRGRDVLQRLSGEQVLNAKQFDFIDNPNIRQSLQDAGYTDAAIKRAAKAANDIVATEAATGEISDADKRILEPLADRAEQVAKWPVNYEKLAKAEAERAGIEFSDLQLPPLDTLKQQAGDEIPFSIDEKKDENRGPRPDLSLRTETKQGRQGYINEDIARGKQGEPSLRSDTETANRAEAIIKRGDPAIHELIQKGKAGETFTDAETVAVKKIIDTQLPDAINKQSVNRMALLGDLIAADRKAGTEAGRAFRQRRDPLTAAQQVRNTLAEAIAVPPVADGKEAGKPERNEHLRRIRKYLLENGIFGEMTQQNLNDPVWVSRILNDISTLNPKANAIYEYFLASVLSGPQTQERNALGNVVNMTMNQIMLRPVEMAINTLMGAKNGPQWGEYRYIWRGMGSRIAASWVNAIQSFRAERAIFQGRLVEGHADITKGPAIKGAKGRVIRTPLRLLTAVDQFMKTMIGMGEVGARAYRYGLEQGLKRGSPEMEQFIKSESDNLDSQSWKEAYAYAKYVAFQDDPGPFTRALTAVRETEIYGFKPFRYVVLGPFLRIAGKLESETWNYTPFGALRIGAKTLTGQYKNNQSAAVHDLAKQVVAWSALGALWALSGSDDDEPWITGTSTKEAKNFAYRTAPPMSIRLPGYGWKSYKHLQPISGAIATIMDGIERIKAMKQGEDALTAVGKFVQHVKERVVDQTFLQALGDFMDAMDSEDKATNFLTNFAASWVPNLIKQPLYQADTKVREAKALADTSAYLQLKRRVLPGVDAALPKVTPWGAEVTKPGNALVRMVDPFATYGGEVNPADAVVARYNRLHPDKPYYVDIPKPTVKVGDSFVKMTEEEYYLFLRLSGLIANRRVSQVGRVRNQVADATTIDAIEKVRNGAVSQATTLMKTAISYRQQKIEERYRAILDRMRKQIARLEQ